jgi:hypothetical protein
MPRWLKWGLIIGGVVWLASNPDTAVDTAVSIAEGLGTLFGKLIDFAVKLFDGVGDAAS